MLDDVDDEDDIDARYCRGQSQILMIKYIVETGQLRRIVLTAVLLLTAAGCSGTNLGNIDETDDPRETMPGPGVLADEQGESPLTLKTGADQRSDQTGPGRCAGNG